MTEPPARPELCGAALFADAAAGAWEPRITTMASPSAYRGVSSASAGCAQAESARIMAAVKIFSFMRLPPNKKLSGPRVCGAAFNLALFLNSCQAARGALFVSEELGIKARGEAFDGVGHAAAGEDAF